MQSHNQAPVRTYSAGGVVINPHGQVVLVDQGSNWSLPKGHLEPGETTEAAARREIAEETGLTDLRLIRQLGSYQRRKVVPHYGDELKTITIYLFTTPQTDLNPDTEDHIRHVEWLAPHAAAVRLQGAHQAFYESILPEINQALRTNTKIDA